MVIEDEEEHECDAEPHECEVCMDRMRDAADIMLDQYKETGIDPFKK